MLSIKFKYMITLCNKFKNKLYKYLGISIAHKYINNYFIITTLMGFI